MSRSWEGTGEARLRHGQITTEVAERMAGRVTVARAAELEQAGGHLLGLHDLVRNFNTEWKEAEKA